MVKRSIRSSLTLPAQGPNPNKCRTKCGIAAPQARNFAFLVIKVSKSLWFSSILLVLASVKICAGGEGLICITALVGSGAGGLLPLLPPSPGSASDAGSNYLMPKWSVILDVLQCHFVVTPSA